MNARTYSSLLRRFIQPDNVDYARYTYVNGDPVGFVDPTGHAAEEEPHFTEEEKKQQAVSASQAGGQVSHEKDEGEDAANERMGSQAQKSQPTSAPPPPKDSDTKTTQGAPGAKSDESPGWLTSFGYGLKIFGGWVSGIGPRVDFYGPDSSATKLLRNDSSYESALERYLHNPANNILRAEGLKGSYYGNLWTVP
jgi:hypothetical protein